MSSEKTTRRLILRRRGFNPLPLSGKRPAMDKWSQKIDVSLAEIELWEKLYPYSDNTGALTRNMPTIDIDIMIPDAAMAIEEIARDMFEESGRFLVRFGKPPKRAIPLRTDTPFKKLTTNLVPPPQFAENKVEILCDGQQVVVAGIHPDTHKPYSWHGGELGDVAWEELPYIHPHEAERLIERISELLINQYGFTRQQKAADPRANGHAGNFHHADWSALMGNIIGGNELHDSIRDLAASFVASDVSIDAAARMLQSLMLVSTVPHDDRWVERFEDISRAIVSAYDKFKQDRGAKPVVLKFLDISNWDIIPVPIRSWSVHERIPTRQATLLSGEGSVGKTILELQLCVAHVLGLDWIGTLPEKGPIIYLGAEDDADELHRRLDAIIRYYAMLFPDRDISFKALAENGFHILSFAGEDCLLGVPNRNGQIMPTPLYEKLLEAVGDIKPKHIGIDTSADVFGGNEIDRGQVRQFVALLRKLAITSGGSVVLLSHPSLTGISTGTGLSGSTGWHNSVRARMFFKASGNDDEDNGLRDLEFKKNNYGPVAHTLKLRYHNGVFIPANAKVESPIEKEAHERRAEDVFLDVFAKLIAQGRGDLSPKKKSHADFYAPAVIARHMDAAGFTQDELEAAMRRLLDKGQLHEEASGPESKRRYRLKMGSPPGTYTS